MTGRPPTHALIANLAAKDKFSLSDVHAESMSCVWKKRVAVVRASQRGWGPTHFNTTVENECDGTIGIALPDQIESLCVQFIFLSSWEKCGINRCTLSAPITIPNTCKRRYSVSVFSWDWADLGQPCDFHNRLIDRILINCSHQCGKGLILLC